MQLAIDRFGRMVLPKAVRDDFNIHPGDTLDLSETEDSIVLTPVARQDFIKKSGGVKVFTGKAAGDVGGALREQRNDRFNRAAAWGTSS
ncbi:MAG: AbrB/MazE/SpoVT family DNA-binding domain-containing protein [Verrucomicrobiota bacterium]